VAADATGGAGMLTCSHDVLMRRVFRVGQGAVLAQRLGESEFVCPRCGGVVVLEVFKRQRGSEWEWGFRIFDLVLR
jgi:predicted RNA-binding Zn-ribbon protein involved in translation (DUF1610 family)